MKWTVTWDTTKNGYRLPTSAEWEYATRAGTTTTYFTGDDILSLQGYANVGDETSSIASGDTSEYIAGFNDGYADTCPVLALSPNPWGLYNTLGNVMEWVWDFAGTDTVTTDPIGPSSTSTGRITRGGSYNNIATVVQCASTYTFHASNANPIIGFRIVRNAD
jgi:formylglycine-generating enzyme required for sulfatase activity